jgi:hypothetical protein
MESQRHRHFSGGLYPHKQHISPSKGWRKNVEALEHLRGICFGVCSVVDGWASESAVGQCWID